MFKGKITTDYGDISIKADNDMCLVYLMNLIFEAAYSYGEELPASKRRAYRIWDQLDEIRKQGADD